MLFCVSIVMHIERLRCFNLICRRRKSKPQLCALLDSLATPRRRQPTSLEADVVAPRLWVRHVTECAATSRTRVTSRWRIWATHRVMLVFWATHRVMSVCFLRLDTSRSKRWCVLSRTDCTLFSRCCRGCCSLVLAEDNSTPCATIKCFASSFIAVIRRA